MTVVVAYKWAANPQDATVADSGDVDWSRARAMLSEYDPAAIALGRRVADAQNVACVGVTVGSADAGSPMARKSALSRGLDRALAVADDQVTGWDRTRVGQALAALVRRVDGADLVLAGEASIDENARVVPALVAGFLGWPCLLDVTEVVAADNGWRLTQQVGDRVRTVQVPGPVVASVTATALAAPVPGMRDIMAAAKKPFEAVDPADLDLTARSATVVARRRAPQPERAQQVFTGDDAVARLVEALRSAGVGA